LSHNALFHFTCHVQIAKLKLILSSVNLHVWPDKQSESLMKPPSHPGRQEFKIKHSSSHTTLLTAPGKPPLHHYLPYKMAPIPESVEDMRNNAVAQINNARDLVSRITLGLPTGHYNVQVLQDGTLTIHSPSVNTPTSIGPNTANSPCGNLSDGALAGIAVGFTIGFFFLFGCLVAACV